MKIIFIVLLLTALLTAQQKRDAYSDYYSRGVFTPTTFDKVSLWDGYQPVAGRTVAVNPKEIIPGAILYIPELAGQRMPDGSLHDGYLLAHALLDTTTRHALALYKGTLPPRMTAYRVYGVMAKSTRTRFELMYRNPHRRPLYEMTARDLDTLLKSVHDNISSLSDRIEFLSALGRGTPYAIFNLGEGPGAPIDPDPTIDLARVDCMTFCENTLAMAVSTDYRQMYERLQKIRYKDGVIEYTHRNHYTIADWLPNNHALLYDATREIGGNKVQTMTKTIDRPGFYKKNGVPDSLLGCAPGKETLSVAYIPTSALMFIKEKLRGGEIVSIVTTLPGIVSAHMGLIARDQWGNVIFRHASSSPQTHEVTDFRFDDYVDKLATSKSRVGMIFMRVRENHNSPKE